MNIQILIFLCILVVSQSASATTYLRHKMGCGITGTEQTIFDPEKPLPNQLTSEVTVVYEGGTDHFVDKKFSGWEESSKGALDSKWLALLNNYQEPNIVPHINNSYCCGWWAGISFRHQLSSNPDEEIVALLKGLGAKDIAIGDGHKTQFYSIDSQERQWRDLGAVFSHLDFRVGSVSKDHSISYTTYKIQVHYPKETKSGLSYHLTWSCVDKGGRL